MAHKAVYTKDKTIICEGWTNESMSLIYIHPINVESITKY